MKNLALVGLLATAAAVNGKELFRYEDEETGQVHYMSSLPDGTVEGGWNFDAPEGKSFELTYTAGKETGFVPKADHLPAAPADTEPVQLEKQKFFAFYNNEPVEGYVPVAPADTEDVLSAKEKFFAFYNNEAVEDYMPQAPVDTPEVEEAKKAFFDFYNKVQVEETEASQAEDSIIDLARKRRAPEDLEDVEELPEDQLAVEARTVDDMAVGEAKTQKKLGHFRVRPYLHHPFHVKPAERLPFKYHPYFNFYRQHHQKKTEDDAEEADAKKEEVIPFQPYHPYFHPSRYHYQSPYHFDPYFYYNYHHGKKPEGGEGEEKDKVEYPESDFYPFYMAKPTEEEIKEYEEKMKEYEEEMKKQEAEFKERQDKMKAEYEEHQEKMKEYQEKVAKELEAYEAKRKEIMEDYAEKMKAAADELELPEHPLIPQSVDGQEDGEDSKGKTISLPVFYHSYFPKWRYSHFTKPKEAEMKEEAMPEEEDSVKEMKKRSAQTFLTSAPATYLPTVAQVTKTIVKPLDPKAPAEQSIPPQQQQQQGIIYYPQTLPVVTRVGYPVASYPVLYPSYQPYVNQQLTSVQPADQDSTTLTVPASTTLIKQQGPADTQGATAAAPLPESVFPIFPKTEGQVDQQAALAL